MLLRHERRRRDGRKISGEKEENQFFPGSKEAKKGKVFAPTEDLRIDLKDPSHINKYQQ